jgi:hypothetical protein
MATPDWILKSQSRKFEIVPLSNPNWCRELHQFEPLVTRIARNKRLRMRKSVRSGGFYTYLSILDMEDEITNMIAD